MIGHVIVPFWPHRGKGLRARMCGIHRCGRPRASIPEAYTGFADLQEMKLCPIWVPSGQDAFVR